MAKAYASTVIDAPASAVWAVVRDFNGLPDWHPAIASSEIEDGLPADQVGCVRNFVTHDGARFRERLLELSDEAMACVYDFQTTPFDVDNYRATLRCTPVTDGDRCFVEWWTTFDSDRERVAEWVDTFANGVFAEGFAGLRRRVSATRG